MKTQILTAMLAMLSFPLWAAIINGPTTPQLLVYAEIAGEWDSDSEWGNGPSPVYVDADAFISDDTLGMAYSFGSLSYSFTGTSFSESADLFAQTTGGGISRAYADSTWHFSITTPTTFSLSGYATGFVVLSLTQDGPNTVLYQHYGSSISGSVLLQPADYTFKSHAGMDTLEAGGSDSASYSFVANVPEPSSISLGMFGVLVVALRRIRNRRSADAQPA